MHKLYIEASDFICEFHFCWYHSLPYIAFSNSNDISAAFLCGNLLASSFVSLAGLGVFFPSFWCAFSCCSFIVFSLLWTLRAFPLLFHLIVLAPIFVPSLLEGKGLGLIFLMKESFWALAKPSKTKLWGRLQCSHWHRNYLWWMFQDRLPLGTILTQKHQVQETEKIFEKKE